MKIIPLAADSLGVRSMATKIITDDTVILIDPAAALGPRRYGLRPHKLELEALEVAWERIVEESEDAEVIVITHYHYDHHSRKRNIEIYKNKILFIKDPNTKINRSQMWRSREFLKKIRNLPREIIVADGREFFIGDTRIKFSPPVPHGEPDTKLGYVLEVLIQEDFGFIFTSDVEGLMDESQLRFILENNPKVVYIDGPPIYLGPRKISDKLLDTCRKNIHRVLSETQVERLIIDHHLLRDLNFREYLHGLNGYITMAEFVGLPLNMLEARRRELWGVD